jgi:hypothetical protein
MTLNYESEKEIHKESWLNHSGKSIKEFSAFAGKMALVTIVAPYVIPRAFRGKKEYNKKINEENETILKYIREMKEEKNIPIPTISISSEPTVNERNGGQIGLIIGVAVDIAQTLLYAHCVEIDKPEYLLCILVPNVLSGIYEGIRYYSKAHKTTNNISIQKNRKELSDIF